MSETTWKIVGEMGGYSKMDLQERECRAWTGLRWLRIRTGDRNVRMQY
jgi:hypothetical protein